MSSQNNTDLTNCASCGVTRNTGERCDYCGALYLDMIMVRPPRRKPRKLTPKYKLTRNGDRIEITWSWLNASVWIMIPFFVIWNTFLLSNQMVTTVLTDPLSAFPIPALHVLVGILGPAYVVICMFNRTTIKTDEKHLSIKHHPIPWPWNMSFETDDIDYIFITKARRSGKNHSWEVPVLQLVTKDKRRRNLLKGQTEEEFADFEALRGHLLDVLNILPREAYGAFS